jgi:hypothetical protein
MTTPDDMQQDEPWEGRADAIEYAYSYLVNKRREDIKDEYDLVTHVKRSPNRVLLSSCPSCGKVFKKKSFCCMNCGYGII